MELGLVGPIIEVCKIWNGRKTQRDTLAAYLDIISTNCASAIIKLKADEVPRVEGKGLAILINKADEIASLVEEKEPGVYKFFTNEILELGNVLRDAGFYVDGRPRASKHRSARTHAVTLRTQLDRDGAAPSNIMTSQLVEKCCMKLESAQGQASAYAAVLRNQ